ncbi:hypothetical protein TNCT_493291 [Trichonephila clavata]|uniref:Uncharacterized protein n=1 Tax=Trichonephila clavata TaxID=2740835 RepID=A0A8X6HV91_TRICU|nr:hypothetical protein TNCT_493291 [Trichonephila clavata]
MTCVWAQDTDLSGVQSTNLSSPIIWVARLAQCCEYGDQQLGRHSAQISGLVVVSQAIGLRPLSDVSLDSCLWDGHQLR